MTTESPRGVPGPDRPIHWEPSLAFVKLVIAFIAISSLAYLAGLLVLAPNQHGRLLVVSLPLLVVVAASELLRRGRPETAVWMMAFAIWTYTTVTSLFVGGVQGTSIIVYPLIILLLGWLVGTRAAVGATVLTAAATLAMALAQTAGWLPEPWPTPPLVRWIAQCFVFALSAVLIRSVVQSYRGRIAEVFALSGDLDRAQSVARLGSWVYDLRLDTIHLSAETCRIYEVPKDTRGRRDYYLERVHPDDQPAVAAAWNRAFATGAPFAYEHRIVSLNGETRWVRQTGEFELGSDGSPWRAVGTTQDITERKRTEEALQLSRIGVERASEALYWVAGDGRFIDVNAAACESVGYTRDELLAMHVTELDADSTPSAWAAHAAMLRAQGSATFESHHRHKDGRIFPVEIVASHVRIGAEERTCAFVRDISERKAREAEVLEARARLQSTLDALPDLLFEVDIHGRYLFCHAPGPEQLAVPAAPADRPDRERRVAAGGGRQSAWMRCARPTRPGVPTVTSTTSPSMPAGCGSSCRSPASRAPPATTRASSCCRATSPRGSTPNRRSRLRMRSSSASSARPRTASSPSIAGGRSSAPTSGSPNCGASRRR